MSHLDLVKELRELTLAGMGDCRKALEEAGWDLQKAVDIIKAKGQNIVSTHTNKVAAEGRVRIITSADSRLASMIEVNCQTDFTAKSKEFDAFVELASLELHACADENIPFSGLGEGIESDRKALMAATKENIVVRRWWVEQAAASEVKIFTYVHSNEQIGVLLTLQAPSIEASLSPEFEALGQDLVLQIAAMSPLAVDSDHLDPNEVARQKSIFETQLLEAKKPQASWEKIMAGKFSKWHSEVCLMDQESIILPKTSIKQVIKNVSTKLGGEVVVVGFTRCQVGEGIEVKKEDFAKEVSALSGV